MHTVTSIYVLCVYMFVCNYMVTLYVRMMAFSLDYCNFPLVLNRLKLGDYKMRLSISTSEEKGEQTKGIKRREKENGG